MNDQKNTILAVVLSAIVLIGWEYFYALPQKQRQEELQRQAQTTQVRPAPQPTPQSTPGPASQGAAPQAPSQSGAGTPAEPKSREAIIASAPRIALDTPRIRGSIALKGARIDDASLIQYHETVDPTSPAVVLLSPSGSPHPFYAEFGWVGSAGANVKVPDGETIWTQEGTGTLGIDRPVIIKWDNGEGLEFRRTIAVDDKYLFTLRDEVLNRSAAPVTLYPFALISRHGTPETLGYAILHEGLIGKFGSESSREVSYSEIEKKKLEEFEAVDAWLGITDKYWAATLLPNTNAKVKARFSFAQQDSLKTYQADYRLDPVTIQPGATGSADARLFAGAKEVAILDGYDKNLKLNRFELLIDWGWFYFITKPMFWAIDWMFKFFGNFGVAILLVTLVIKFVFFPLANKSYASMAKMKAVQPQLAAIRERFPDDKMKQQQAMMEIYKKEKINPLAGCLPIAIQIPVFFSFYKVLFVTIEMRHAPFFGWIRDLSAADPSNVFNLFGLIPYDPTVLPMIGSFLHLGAWPLIMGVTMWVQMKLNPAPPDPTQAMIFNWMPIIFTFMLANFPAGLVIYWAWNNTLSVAQQSIIMRKHGAKIELFDNIKAMFVKKAS